MHREDWGKVRAALAPVAPTHCGHAALEPAGRELVAWMYVCSGCVGDVVSGGDDVHVHDQEGTNGGGSV